MSRPGRTPSHEGDRAMQHAQVPYDIRKTYPSGKSGDDDRTQGLQPPGTRPPWDVPDRPFSEPNHRLEIQQHHREERKRHLLEALADICTDTPKAEQAWWTLWQETRDRALSDKWFDSLGRRIGHSALLGL